MKHSDFVELVLRNNKVNALDRLDTRRLIKMERELRFSLGVPELAQQGMNDDLDSVRAELESRLKSKVHDVLEKQGIDTHGVDHVAVFFSRARVYVEFIAGAMWLEADFYGNIVERSRNFA